MATSGPPHETLPRSGRVAVGTRWTKTPEDNIANTSPWSVNRHGSHLSGLAIGRGRPPLLLAQPLQRLVRHLHFAEAQLVDLALGFVG